MHRAPGLVGQWDDGGALQTREHRDDFLQALAGSVHADVFLVFGLTHGTNAEEQLLQRLALHLVEMLVANQEGLALHHHFHLAQVVAHQRRTAAHDVENAIGKTNARRYLHTAGNHVNLDVDAFLFHETAKDVGVGGGYLLALKPLQAIIVFFLGNGKRQTAAAETKTAHDVGLLAPLLKLVLAHYTNIGHATGHTLWNVVVAEIKHFEGKIGRLHQKGALAGTDFDVGFGKKMKGILIKTALRLYGYS